MWALELAALIHHQRDGLKQGKAGRFHYARDWKGQLRVPLSKKTKAPAITQCMTPVDRYSVYSCRMNQQMDVRMNEQINDCRLECKISRKKADRTAKSSAH